MNVLLGSYLDRTHQNCEQQSEGAIMRKFIRILGFILAMQSIVSAKEVPISVAERVAINWMIERSPFTREQLRVSENFSVTEGSVVVYFVFNMNPSGFVIVSADDVAYPVISYSFEGFYKPDMLSPAFDFVLDNVKREISFAVKSRLSPLPNATVTWSRLNVSTSMFRPELGLSPVALPVSTLWGQGDPYNRLCPFDSNANRRTPTGCVATAMAQIMKFYNYPTSGIGSIEYVHSRYGRQAANFGTTTYSWSQMPNELHAGSSQNEINAVSTLMYHCGVSVRMDYGPGGSGAWPLDARNALVENFGYSVEAAYRDKNDCTDEAQWIQLMKDEIDQGRPVLYSGYNARRDTGHSFVLDGYQGDAHFHFNWGWGGIAQDNAWFLLSSITPAGFNFSFSQSAIIRIIPARSTLTSSPVLWLAQTNWNAPSVGGTTSNICVVNSNPRSSSVAIAYNIASDVQWLTLSATSGNTPGGFTITAQPNNGDSARTGRVTVTATTSGVIRSPIVITISQPTNRTQNPVDVALVIDRSGSMGTYGYMEPAKTAARTFVGLMQTNDNIAVVSFSSSASVNFPLTRITSDATKIAAQNAISTISSSGATSIGSGLQAGQSQLDRGRTGSHQAMILLSDGEENTPPLVADVLPTIPVNTDIYTIALGPQSDLNLLNNIAANTGGRFYYAPDASKLQEIYNMLRGTVSNLQTVASFSGTVNQGSTASHAAPIDRQTSFASFSATFSSGNLSLILQRPDGRIIDSAAAAADTNVIFSKGSTFVLYNVRLPLEGDWQLRVTGLTSSPVAYTTSIQSSSNLRLHLFLDKIRYEARQPMLVNAILSTNLNPVTGALVKVFMQRPVSDFSQMPRTGERGRQCEISGAGPLSGQMIFAIDTLLLFDDGLHSDGAADDGLYSNYYYNTQTNGSYTLSVVAEGGTSPGSRFRRESSFSTTVIPSSRPAVPLLAYPPNGLRQVPLSTILKWIKPDSTSSFEIQVSYILSSPLSQTNINVVDTIIAADSLQLANLSRQQTYFWRVRAVGLNGQLSDWSSQWSFMTSFDEANVRICYPNPFNPALESVKFRFKLERPGIVKIKIYDISNSLVKEIKSSLQYDEGVWELEWDGRNEGGELVGNGIYFYVVESSSGERNVNKVAVLK
jgi:Mg-chelatase subunit ChlD